MPEKLVKASQEARARSERISAVFLDLIMGLLFAGLLVVALGMNLALGTVELVLAHLRSQSGRN